MGVKTSHAYTPKHKHKYKQARMIRPTSPYSGRYGVFEVE